MRTSLIIAVCACVSLLLTTARAEVIVATGPTTIPRGDAVGVRDITVSNDLFAIAFAVDTAPPWGVARGGIVDIAPIRDGIPGYDIASLADFMPNRWSSWPTSYQTVTVEKASPAEAVIKTVRDWGEVELETTFHVRDGDSRVHMLTRMTNNGDEVLEELRTGYVAWPDGGSLFGVPGLPGPNAQPEDKALADWSAAYDEHWVLGLHAPFSEIVERAGRDRYLPHDLQPGETRTFEAWLQIENDGTLAPLVKSEIEFRQLAHGRIFGRVVSTAGDPVTRPAIIVYLDGSPYSWALGVAGDYELVLPAGDYDIYATASGFGRSASRKATVSNGSDTRLNFEDVPSPGSIAFRVTDEETGDGLDARISIREGYKPLIGYFGKDTFFTELDSVGELTVEIAPGDYVFEFSAGGGFTSEPRTVAASVESSGTQELRSGIAVTASPSERGWYSADLHHHSDVLDGFTEAEYVLRSELASGVDIAFLSDHDSVANNKEMQSLSATRDRFFIAGAELSPSWGHFNAYPLHDDKTVGLDTGQATVQEVFAEARRMGAEVIAANHPYSEYGYFNNHELGAVPGGYDPGFDLVEIGPVRDNKNDLVKNPQTISRAWQLWNDGHKAYLTSGSDVHDVWNFESGRARTYVHVEGDLSIEKFVGGLKAGHAFASQGPLIYPDTMFGSELNHAAGDELALKYAIQAVSGLQSVRLIERGSEVDRMLYDGSRELIPVEFSVSLESSTWYSLIVEDMNGRSAYTNPVWVTVTK